MALETLEIIATDEGQWIHEIGEPWQPLSREHSLSGHFALHKAFRSQFLSQSRDIMIYLPPSYQKHRKTPSVHGGDL